ncbi:MAG: hypothetical protein ABID54_06685 [Pseudomonadota bacterium]
MSLSEICWSSGVPTCLCVACLPCWHRQARRQVEGEQASTVSSAERKGKVFPTCEPRKGHCGSSKRRDKGVQLSVALPRSVRITEG